MNQHREYKSNLFSMLMEVPEHALEVYNVLNDSHYTDPSQIQIMKLEKGVILSIRNDASFLLDAYLNLYEHQSTYNPNMPLRFLIYFSNLMLEIIKEQEYDLFGRKQIPIPTPKFVVFYNGSESRPDREEMRLSDAYEHHGYCLQSILMDNSLLSVKYLHFILLFCGKTTECPIRQNLPCLASLRLSEKHLPCVPYCLSACSFAIIC